MIHIDWAGFVSGFDTIDMFLFQYCLVGKTDRCVIPLSVSDSEMEMEMEKEISRLQSRVQGNVSIDLDVV